METLKDRLPPLPYVVLVVALFCFGSLYLVRGVEDHRQATALRQAGEEIERGRIAEIEVIKGRLRGVNSQDEQICANTAGFRRPEDSIEHELARLQRIEACVGELAKPKTH